MRRLSVLFICLAFTSIAYSQKTRAARFISFFEAPGSGYLSVFSLSQIPLDLFDDARRGELPVYYFEALSRDPQKIAWSDLGKRIIANDLKRYPAWQRDVRYHPLWYSPQAGDTLIPASIVNYANRIYQANRESINIPPSDSVMWQPQEPNFQTTLLGLDFRVLSGDTVLQYIHCFRDSLTYLASFRASDAIPALNASHEVAYAPNPNFGAYVAGDLFLITPFDGSRMINQLWPILDTAKIKDKNDGLFGFTGYQPLVRYRDEKLANLYFARDEIIEDTLTGPQISKFIAPHHPSFLRTGDAMSNLQKIGFKLLKQKYFKPLNPVEGPGKPAAVERLESTRELTFSFNWQHPDQQFVRNMTAFLDLVFRGVASGRIRVFKSPSLQSWFKPDELVLYWAVKSAQEWIESDTYDLEEVVLFNKLYYCSTEGGNRGNAPDANPKLWTPDKIILFQPGHIESIKITSAQTYDTDGRRVSGTDRCLELLTDSKSLGYFGIDELKSFISSTSPMLWDQTLKWIGTNGIVEQTASPLTVAK